MSEPHGDLPPHLREKQRELQQTREALEAARPPAADTTMRLDVGFLRLWLLAGIFLIVLVPTGLWLAGVRFALPTGTTFGLGVGFLIPLCVGLFFGFRSTLDFVTASAAAKNRTRRATGLITAAELDKRPGRHGWLYCPVIHFSFEADGRTVEREFRPIDYWHNVESWHEKTLAEYPVGSTLTVQWDPDQPLNSTPDRPVRQRWFGRFLYYFCAAGIGLSIFLLMLAATG